MEIERRCMTLEEAPECELVIETRASGREAIRGLAIPYNRLSLDLGGFRERILPGAFDKILSRQRGRSEILSYYNHNSDLLLGRESAGTLTVTAEEKGISYTVEPPDTSAGRDVLALVRSRNLTGSSFAFTVAQRNGERFTTDEGGKAIREIVEASGLYELGPVNVPAYGSATSAVVAQRSYAQWMEALAAQAEADPTVEPEKKKALRSLARDAAAAWSLRLRNV
jgi:HK97 family phage prohead protease